MPNYDRKCTACDETFIDCYEPINVGPVECPKCQAPTERVWLGHKSFGVIPDDIPGGIEITHGICNEDGSPRKYYSKSEMRREADRRGFTNFVQHQPLRGSDKSPHTTRWV